MDRTIPAAGSYILDLIGEVEEPRATIRSMATTRTSCLGLAA